MRVIYEGIDLGVLECHEFFAEPVYDDSRTDYLYTRFSVVVTALINGQADVVNGVAPIPGPFVSYAFGDGEIASTSSLAFRVPTLPVGQIKAGDGDGLAVGKLNNNMRTIVRRPTRPALTYQTILHRLTTPRGKLYVFAGGGQETGTPAAGSRRPPSTTVAELILEAPAGTFTVDAKNGPTPRLLGVTRFMGDAESMVVEFAIDFFLNQAAENNVRPFGALVSNRWKQLHSVKSGYTTIQTEGIAIFRTDLIDATLSSPDVERARLFMPTLQNFEREVDYVETREDVSGLAYGYTDRQKAVNFVAGPYVGARDMEAIHRQSVTANIDILGGAFSLAERATGMLLNAKWLKGERARPGMAMPPRPAPAAPGGAGAGRLRVPGAGP